MSDLLLLSGGLDSTAAAAYLRPAAGLVIDYGQVVAPGELRAARAVGRELGLPVEVLSCDCSSVGSGLLGASPEAEVAPSAEWWPFRNQLLATLAAAWCVSRGYSRLLFGSVATDGFHRDGQPQFYELLSSLLAFQEGELVAEAPTIGSTTLDLCRRADVSRALLGWTFSCHRTPVACGDCPGCNKRRMTLRSLGFA
jgi:7-cyano-7-deazaguanine synthase